MCHNTIFASGCYIYIYIYIYINVKVKNFKITKI